MQYREFLGRLHDLVEPATYLEVGVRNGDSLALSRARSVGIDPAYVLRAEIDTSLALFRTTSDEYFARPEPLAPFAGAPIDLAFIDGMHLFEYSLRDFLNIERHASWTGVVVFDDVLPRSVPEAARDRHTRGWTGDVYKVLPVLRRHRPDLILLPVGTSPTGLLVILGLDPASTTLRDAYDDLEREWVVPDPQVVPPELLSRKGVFEPSALLAAPFWTLLREMRAGGVPRAEGLAALRAAVEEASAGMPTVGPPAVPDPVPWPPAPAASKAPAAAPPPNAGTSPPGLVRRLRRRARRVAKRLPGRS